MYVEKNHNEMAKIRQNKVSEMLNKAYTPSLTYMAMKKAEVHIKDFVEFC